MNALQDFAQRDRTFAVEVTDASGDTAMVRGRALLGRDAIRARKALADDSATGVWEVLRMVSSDLASMTNEDVEHLVNRCGGFDGGFGDLFRLGVGHHAAPPEVGGAEEDPTT